MIPPEKLEEIKESNDIVDVVSDYLTLKRAGRNFKTHCPFHQEKTPSFMVSPEKQIFHCFGCDAGGNVFSFIQKIENVPFVEAANILARKAGIKIEEQRGGGRRAGEKEKLMEINRDALYFFRKEFKNSPEAAAYLEKRKISTEAAEEFGLGYSPGFGKLYAYLKDKGHSGEMTEKTSLVKKKEGRFIDSFHKRVIFPIFNIYGDPIAFGGRVLDGSLPKYINSGESAVYHKGRSLYNIQNAKKYRKDFVVLVEGYTDAISVYVNGVKNVTASLGTAFTREQAGILKRYFTKAVIAYDMDDAGRAGAARAGEILFAAGVEVFVACFEGAKDPDEFTEKNGRDALVKAIDKAVPFIEYAAGYLAGKTGLSSPYARERIIKDLTEIIKQSDSPVIRESAVSKVSEIISVAPETIESYLKKDTYEMKRFTAMMADIKSLKEKGVVLAEKTILSVAFSSAGRDDGEIVLKHVFSRRGNYKVEYADFINKQYAGILKKLEEYYGEYGAEAVEKIQLYYLDNTEITGVISEILAEISGREKDSTEDLMDIVDDCYFKIKKDKTRLKMAGLQQRIEAAEKSGDFDSVTALLKEKKECQKIITQRGEYFE